MFNSITSLFLILTVASIPGQLVVLVLVALFRNSRSNLVSVKSQKHLLLIGYALTLSPFLYMLVKKLALFFTTRNYTGFIFGDPYSTPYISNTFFRNEWLMPLAIIWSVGVLYNLYRSNKKLLDFRDRALLEGSLSSLDELNINHSELPAQVINYLTKATIIKHPAAQSPLVFGYRKRFLIIPDQALTQKQLNMVLRHEMTHLMHKDLWTKLLAEIVRLLFFYNIIFVTASRLLDEICEQLCDQAVISEMSTEDKKEYGYLLLNMLEQAQYGNVMTQAALSKDKRQVKYRLQAIIQPLKVSRLKQYFVTLLASIAVIISILAIIMIIPEANKWDQSRQLLSALNFNQDTQATTAVYILPEYTSIRERTYSDIHEETYSDPSTDEHSIMQTTIVVD